ncbi:inositol phospholipid biosynthesis protein SCS3 [Pseudohyphozyma bogoriensis]|nr:inositol phospholipid biosynthesis protein SCS3 [Pseudohyphozyma bogoriensis]
MSTIQQRRSPAPASSAAAGMAGAEPVGVPSTPRTRGRNLLQSSPLLVPFLAVLVSTSLVGTFVSHNWSLSRNVHLSQTLRSRLPAAALDNVPAPIPYFGDKRNVFNQVFVKLGWAWTTLAFFLYLVAAFAFPPSLYPNSIVIHTNRVSPCLANLRRYLLATTFWWFLTQGTWFFGAGPSIAARVLVLSGAVCIPRDALEGGGDQELVCRGGPGEYWKGGHDVSGHTFMMVLASLLLFQTITPTLVSFPLVQRIIAILRPSTPSTSLEDEEKPLVPTTPVLLATYANLALIGLWWWMLLMTSVYFHTPLEKISGLLFGLGGWLFTNL